MAALLFAALPPAARAWGAEGHRAAGAIADRLLAGSHAEQRVHALLGDLSLEQAAVWADCAKGIDPKKGYAYTAAGRFPECQVFETPQGEAEMAAFVRRNDTNCPRRPEDESCHRQYHYTDVAIQRTRYAPGLAGTRDFDIVGAVAAATQVLQGDPAPAPFDIQGPREALLLLAHYVGDIHQPLHVGAIYLDAGGARVDPDATGPDPSTDTRGGNQLVTMNLATNRRSANLHQTWDDVPLGLQATEVGPRWVAQARKLPRTPGAVAQWPGAWASETLLLARASFAGLRFAPEANGEWTLALSCRYNEQMGPAKKRQITRAGARLAQLLRAVWP